MGRFKSIFFRILFTASWLILAGCNGTISPAPTSTSQTAQESIPEPQTYLQVTPRPIPIEPNGETTMFEITSSAFKNMEGIPEIYTCKGKDISPPLSWSTPPEGTQSLALIMDDPDAPVGTWDHWILFNIPTSLQSIEENITLLPEIMVGQNSWRRNNYGGPCPPGGARHRYYFKLYALDTKLDLQEGSRKADIEKAMENHILGSAELIGIYKP